MITELLISLFLGLASSVITLIPTINFESGFWEVFGTVGNVMNGISYVMPMKTLGVCLAIFFLLHNATFIISILNWIIRKIPGIN